MKILQKVMALFLSSWLLFAPGAIYAAASFWLRGDMSSVFRRHPASGQPSAAIRELTTSRSSTCQLHFVAILGAIADLLNSGDNRAEGRF